VPSKLSYANVMSTLAMFVAVGGTAYAAVTVEGADGRDGSIPSPDNRQDEQESRGVTGSKAAGISFRPYEYGVAGITKYSAFENFVGLDGGAGALGVRSRQPNGNPDAGAMLYARDYADEYSLTLDFRHAARPRLLSESTATFSIETRERAPIVLNPSSWVKPNRDGTVPRRTAPPGRVEVRGYVSLQALDVLPPDGPVGTLVFFDDHLHVRTSRGWVALPS